MEPFKKMKIFLTGSSGFLGQRVLKKYYPKTILFWGLIKKKILLKKKISNLKI